MSTRWTQEQYEQHQAKRACGSRPKTNLPPEDSKPAALMEHSAGPVAVAADKVQESHRPRFLVCITSVRKRLLDEDNLCPKYHVDLCRYAGALPGDTPGDCKIQTTQRKAGKGEKEHTEITIDEVVGGISPPWTSPVTDNPQEDAFYEKVEKDLKK